MSAPSPHGKIMISFQAAFCWSARSLNTTDNEPRKRIHVEPLKHEMKGEQWKQKGCPTCLPTDADPLWGAQTSKNRHTWGGIQTRSSEICFPIHLVDFQKLIEGKQKLTTALTYVLALLFSAEVNHNKSRLFPSKLTAWLWQLVSDNLFVLPPAKWPQYPNRFEPQSSALSFNKWWLYETMPLLCGQKAHPRVC